MASTMRLRMNLAFALILAVVVEVIAISFLIDLVPRLDGLAKTDPSYLFAGICFVIAAAMACLLAPYNVIRGFLDIRQRKLAEDLNAGA